MFKCPRLRAAPRSLLTQEHGLPAVNLDRHIKGHIFLWLQQARVFFFFCKEALCRDQGCEENSAISPPPNLRSSVWYITVNRNYCLVWNRMQSLAVFLLRTSVLLILHFQKVWCAPLTCQCDFHQWQSVNELPRSEKSPCPHVLKHAVLKTHGHNGRWYHWIGLEL